MKSKSDQFWMPYLRDHSAFSEILTNSFISPSPQISVIKTRTLEILRTPPKCIGDIHRSIRLMHQYCIIFMPKLCWVFSNNFQSASFITLKSDRFLRFAICMNPNIRKSCLMASCLPIQNLVDRPTQLICISDIYLPIDKYKRHSRAIYYTKSCLPTQNFILRTAYLL